MTSKPKSVSNLRTSISLSLPQGTLDRIKIEANKCGISHEDLIKIWLWEKLNAK